MSSRWGPRGLIVSDGAKQAEHGALHERKRVRENGQAVTEDEEACSVAGFKAGLVRGPSPQSPDRTLVFPGKRSN